MMLPVCNPVAENENFLELLVVLWLSCLLSVCMLHFLLHISQQTQLLYHKYQHDTCCPSIESFSIFRFAIELSSSNVTFNSNFWKQ